METYSRFFIENKIGEDDNEVVVSDSSQTRKISKVLRRKKGDKLIILDDSGYEFVCEIKQVNAKLVLLGILEKRENKNEPNIKAALYQSIIKKDKMDLVFEKGTEVGVSEFHPMLSKYSVKLSLKEDRAEKILKEASEQSRRGRVPKLFKAKKFKEVLKGVDKEDLNIIFHEKEEKSFFIDFLSESKGKLKEGKRKVNLFVGPEGGFSEEEIEQAEEEGFLVFSLGKRTLRAETAAIFASSLLFSFDI